MDIAVKRCQEIAANMRKDMIELADCCAGDAHWGGSLSCADILAVLYGEVMNCKERDLSYAQKDKFILSKGHSAMALYTALVETGIESRDIFTQFQQNGSLFAELAVMNEENGIECSGGSLGLGLPMGVGMALKAKRMGETFRTYVLTGDGELDEGSNWEAVMAAAQFGLDNLVLIVDRNGWQSDGANKDVMTMEHLKEQLNAFGWSATVVDGHDYEKLLKAFTMELEEGKPVAIIADTVKGKGISFMENDNRWHHEVLQKELLLQARKEVGVE